MSVSFFIDDINNVGSISVAQAFYILGKIFLNM